MFIFPFFNYFLRKTDKKHQCWITFEELTASPHWPNNCLVDPKVQTDWFLENRFQFFWCPVFCACKFACPLLVWPLGQDWMGFLCPLQPYEHTSVGAYFSWLFFSLYLSFYFKLHPLPPPFVLFLSFIHPSCGAVSLTSLCVSRPCAVHSCEAAPLGSGRRDWQPHKRRSAFTIAGCYQHTWSLFLL